LYEAKFLDVIGTKIFYYSQSPLFTDFTPSPLEQKLFETGFSVNIVYENLKSENSQDYAQKPQRNFMFMNSASGEEGWREG
jgi:hypothetical protein